MTEISTGKWDKYLAFKSDPYFHPYLPETMLFTQDNFKKMTEKYESVIIKPSHGNLGKGVMKVTRLKENIFCLNYMNLEVRKDGVKETYLFAAAQQEKLCIIQQWIPLAKINKSMFDLRVMVQRRRKSTAWTVTGIAARVTYPQSVITNAAVKVIPLEEALNQADFLTTVNQKGIINEVYKLGVKSAVHLQKFYPKNREFGMDIAIDQFGCIWIIEANIRPMINMFEIMGDSEVYARIKEYRAKRRRRGKKGNRKNRSKKKK
ncbi:YheC/YheD family protein [Alteribacter natronophilus]|uniref:YheC/YheD family protein n=1 Tax=Alteribacter natronophilus TaxID=2583810 RepID=UPI001486871E|nr:YheC/YheD family protein [Alteribacter natronophilus]